MPQTYFPLRWESTGDQWWYASPIDWAAANGHYDLVRELLHLDTNLLIKLTSLRRIRRLETVWDDDSHFKVVAKCRSGVARSLFHECEMKNKKNSLIRAGYGGWLLYTAASAGDMSFVQELLERDPLLVFGEGEYGVTDIFYAAARSNNSEVFRLLLDFAGSPRFSIRGERNLLEASTGGVPVFKREIMNRAAHAAARGGNLEILKELLVDSSGILAYRDLHGCTLLHSASGRGQVEVVKHLITSFDIINSRDNQGNTSLHVAAFRGHLSVVEALVIASPTCATSTNSNGDTFLHMAVAGFRTPGFRRLDRQMELMRQMVNGNAINIQEIVNIENNVGRTALHMAVAGNVHSDLVELLMTVQPINLNIRDVEGMTPLDILRQHPRSASSEIMIKQLISAGGISNSKDYIVRSAIASQLKERGIGSSPGTYFGISDAEIFLYTGIEIPETSGRPSSCSTASNFDHHQPGSKNEKHKVSCRKKRNPVENAAMRLKKILLRWPHGKEMKLEIPKKFNDDNSFDSMNKWSDREEPLTPLREQFSKETSLPNNKRTLTTRSSVPSPSTKKKFATNLMHGVIQTMPNFARASRSTCSSLRSSISSDKKKTVHLESESSGASCSDSSTNSVTMGHMSQKSGMANGRAINQYFCFGAQRLAADDLASRQKCNGMFKRPTVSVA